MKSSKFLLFLPLLFLCAFAAFFQHREKQQTIENSKPFKILVEETKIVSSVGANNNWRIEIRTYINCEGRRPEWWGKTAVSFALPESYFSSKGKRSIDAYYSGAGYWSEKQDRYCLSSVFEAGKPRSQLRPANFTTFIYFQDNNPTQDAFYKGFHLTLPIVNDTQPFEEDETTWMLKH